MSVKTPQERLEIKEFVLDSNLFLVANAFYMVCYSAGFLYFLISLSYFKGIVEFPLFLGGSVFFMCALFFSILGHRSIQRHKKYISRLDTVFDTPKEEENDYARE